MANKKCRKPKKVIDLNKGISGSYIIYSLGFNGDYIKNGAPKDIGVLLPFIDSRAYGGITFRAKKDILSSSKFKNRSKLIKKLSQIKL